MALRAAVVGVGAMGKHHARVYNELENVELAAVSDMDAEAMARVARCYKVMAYTSFREMLDAEKPDMVTVATPTSLHHEVAMECMARDIHTLVEKPIATTLAEAEEMVERAASRNLCLTVGHIERFNPAVLELKRRLDAGELGHIFQIHARRLGPFPSRIRDTGVVLDLATHELDVMAYLVGSPIKQVYARTRQRIHSRCEDLVLALLQFDDETLGLLNVNWLTPTKTRELSLTGERGMFVVNYLTQDLYFYENSLVKDAEWGLLHNILGVGEGRMLRYPVRKAEPLRQELAAFAEAVENGTAPLVTGHQGVQVLRLALALLESGQTGKLVAL